MRRNSSAFGRLLMLPVCVFLVGYSYMHLLSMIGIWNVRTSRVEDVLVWCSIALTGFMGWAVIFWLPGSKRVGSGNP